MSLVMDSRIAQRRQLVLEEDARRRLRWLVTFFWTVTMAGLLLALVRSPWLDIDEVRVSGARNADIQLALVEAEITLGVPTLSVDAAMLTEALEADPWVARADVAVVWPRTVEITILEHQPVAWIETRNGWMRVSAAGTVIERSKAPPDAAATVIIDGDVAGKVGEPMSSRPALAAVNFLANLPDDLRRRAKVWGDAGEMTATVRGRRIELGTVGQMAEKAAVVAGLMAQEGLPKGAIVNVVAPTRPAVSIPQPQLEGATSARSAPSTSG
jgi:cell division protein FtsQ